MAEVSMNVMHQFKPGEPLTLTSKEAERKQAQWQVSVDPVTGSQDELFVCGKRVVWYNGLNPSARVIKVSYTMETTVLEALWCQFEEGYGDKKASKTLGDAKPLRGVCVREQACLTLFLQTGAVHYVTLPFQVDNVWALSSGLLVERSLSSGIGYEGLPMLFTLLHPSDDLCPVTCRRPAEASMDVSVLGFFRDPLLRVLCVCADNEGEPLVVTCNSSTGQHCIWSVQKATKNDVPAHVTTPLKSGSSLETPQHPLSSSAPSCYGNDVMATPTPLMDTPVEMVLSAHRTYQPHHDREHARLPHLAQAQRRGVTEGSAGKQEGGSGARGYKTGRSPYITRLQTPHKGSAKHSKSLSPHVLARISPFSQAVNSRSWSTFYSDEFSFGHNFEPLLPQVCLWQVWRQEVEANACSTISEGASLHKTSDFTGNKYLLLCLPAQQQLWLINYTTNRGESLSFGALTTLAAVQVVPIEGQPMFILMSASGDLQLYSGTHKVATLNTHSLLNQLSEFTIFDEDDVAMETDATPSSVVSGIRDPLNGGFTVVWSSGEMMRCFVEDLFRHSTVSLCLHALREVLPSQLTMELLSSYYTASHSLPFSELVEHFESWLLACLGMPQMGGQVGGASELSPWERVQQMVRTENMVAQVPALALFLKDDVEIGGVHSSDSTPMDSSTPSLKGHTETVLLALHLVYEELKLNILNRDHLSHMASLLSHISAQLHFHGYVDHYWRDFPHLQHATMSSKLEEQCSTPSPPHILDWLMQTLTSRPVDPFPALPNVCTRTAKLLKLFSLYCTGEGGSVELGSVLSVLGREGLSLLEQQEFKKLQESTVFPWERVILCLAEENLGLSNLETFPVGVALPLWDSIIQCQENPPPSWPRAAYDIIGRKDILESLEVTAECSNGHLKMEDPKECGDGMEMNREILQLRFPADQRVGVARRFLQSFHPVRIALTQRPEVSDHDFLELQESCLLTICQRTMALPVGRGMFTLSTAQPLPTAHLAIPNLNLSGRVPPKNSTVGLDHIDKPANMSAWAEFHNGVAAGLKIAPGISQLNRAWVIYNRPTSEDLTNEYAGFLMALGLQGHLTSVPHYELYNHLKEKHELTVISLLLGVTTTSTKAENLSLASLLSIYFPPLLPHGSADMEVPSSIQTAAMLGLGYIYRSSGNRHMAEIMLKEIGRTQGPELEFSMDRESYSLTAGLALGLITLGVGSSLVGLSDLHLVDQLCLLMNGGLKTQVTIPRPASDGYLVLEGNQVNTHVTAPGAILALTLMYLKTNDSTVAAVLEAPPTQYELEGIRPDFLLLRSLGHCLIMWDSVELTVEWIKANHLPKLVSDHAFQGVKGKTSDAVDYQTLGQAYVNIVAGCCLGMGLCYAGTSNSRAKNCLLECLREMLGRLESSGVEQVGRPCLEKGVVTVLLALAVVMSGSGDLDVLRMIRRLRLSLSEVCYGFHMAVHMALGLLFIGGGRYSLNRSNESIASLLISLYPMFPSTSTDNRYHLQALRHLYVLAAEPRVLITTDVTTGKTCSVDVEIWTDGNMKRTLTPCIVPEWSTIDRVSVCSDSYWPMTFDLKSSQQNKLRKSLPITGCIFVKQRTTQFSESSRHGWSYGLGMVKGEVDISPADLSGDPLVKTMYQQLAQPHMQKDSSWTKFLVACLLECVQNEKFQVFTSLLQLKQCTLKASKFYESLTSQYLWQVKLARALSIHSDRSYGSRQKKAIVSGDFTEGLMMTLKNSLEEKETKCYGSAQRVNKLLQQYTSTDSVSAMAGISEEESRLLAAALVLYDIPCMAQLKLTGHSESDIHELGSWLTSLGLPMTAVVRLLIN